MSHPFDRYFKRHGHYPRLRIPNGVQEMTVTFAPGYIHIKTSPPYGGEIYILAGTARRLIRQHRRTILRMIRMQDRNFDVPKRVHQAHLDEAAITREIKLQKKLIPYRDHPGTASATRQRRRYLAAKRRARRGT